jgi:hypothetical protein
MIAISSARRHEKNAEYARNQKRACDSWRLFNSVYYFGSYEEELKRDNVLWVKSEEWPTIKSMAEFAAWIQGDLAAIINADIVVTEQIIEVEKKLKELTIPSATSYRFQFDPEVYPDLTGATRNKNDRGMDVFVCTPQTWSEIAKEVPEYLRIGHPTWDTWVCGFLCSRHGFGFREFTSHRCIFHPKHEGRETPHSEAIRSDHDYFTMAKRPSPLTEYTQ